MTKSQHAIQMITPAATWRDAIPSGNGALCAMVYGGISPETVLFNHDALWYGARRTEVPDVAELLPVVRAMVLAGDFAAANNYYTQHMQERGFSGVMPSMHPAFDLRVRQIQTKAFRAYSRALDFSTGQTTVRWVDNGIECRRDFFVSRATKNLAMMRLHRDDKCVSAGFALCEHNLMDLIDMAGIQQKLPFTYSTHVEKGMLVLKATGSDGGDFGAVLRLYAPGGVVESGYGTTWAEQSSGLVVMWNLGISSQYHLQVIEASEIVAAVAIYVNTPMQQAVPRLIEQLSKLDGDYDAEFTRHCALHTPLFSRCVLELETPETDDLMVQSNERLLLDAYQGEASLSLINHLYDMGRYLLISCSDRDSNPPTLQGTWNGDYYPPWNSFYVHNENTQMFYWQALPGSIPEVTWAMILYFERFLDDYRQNARKLFGCRGIFIPLTADAGTGILQDLQPHVIYFTGVAPWISQHFFDYWLFTRDLDFLRKHTYPFLRECALFYQDYIELDDQGYCRIIPSNSPENAPYNSVPEDFDRNRAMNPGIPLTINSTIDTALVREVFTNAITACTALGIDDPELAVWKDLLSRLRPFRINDDGALAEWIHPDHMDSYAHRHLSHIYPLFPGFQITRENTELFDAVGVAMDKRMTVGLEALTGWSLAHQANIHGRMGNAEKAIQCLNMLCQTCLGTNLLTYHNDYRSMGATLNVILNLHAPYQVDAIMGISSAVLEMLLFSYPGTLRLLPALPGKWVRGRVGRMSTRDGVGVDLSWDMLAGLITATLSASVDTVFTLTLPHGFTCNETRIVLQKGQAVVVEAHSTDYSGI